MKVINKGNRIVGRWVARSTVHPVDVFIMPIADKSAEGPREVRKLSSTKLVIGEDGFQTLLLRRKKNQFSPSIIFFPSYIFAWPTAG